ncbi:adenylate/guanylate cyclase domain-containing protein [Polyangium fumosum]|uniref:Adenylate/guanylate cyclase domain-containing protein n=1 Tax=Polyangium fumosum TaxID=889272 RepID=A0A4U1J950_9BACT|nr:adenylate/guanylate cyclase domain-containing protein [Polyangium fumosum]TKD03397.1 adenylate/guanylate cyclase domain-containing protein [Polyangium fumosum]
MAFTDDLTAEVIKILKEQWQTRDGNKVPDTPELKLANDAVKLNGTVLYADLADSTGLVMLQTPGFVAEVYKCYLNCACRIIREKGGEITAFDGDRVMAVFLGDGMATRACRAALAINHAVVKILNPKVREQYPKLPADFAIKQAVGIDMSPLFVARTGIRGANDLVWVGRAANIAAKLCSLREGNYATYITNDVYAAADNSVRTSSDGKSMWESNPQSVRNLTVYRSGWHWGL